MSITRVPVDRCAHPECPAPDSMEWHYCWAREIKGHKCFGGLTHQHFPKKGMGGNNPNSKIVASLCAGIHDQIDNGTKFENTVLEFPALEETRYIIYRDKGNER